MLKKYFDGLDYPSVFLKDIREDKEYSYADFFGRVLHLTQRMECRSEEGVIAVLENSAFLAALYFAALFAGRRIYAVEPKKSRQEKDAILGSITDGWLVSEREDDDNAPYEELRKAFQEPVCAEEDTKELILDRLDKIDYEKVYLVTFTSGTTGVAKGVMNSAKNLILTSLALAEKLPVPEKSTFLHLMPMTYMAGILNSIFYPFLTAQKIVIAGRFDVKNAIKFWNIVEENQVRNLWAAPSMLAMVAKMDRKDTGINYCRRTDMTIMVGTAALTEGVRREFEEKYRIPLYASYGLSETLFISIETPRSRKYGTSVGEVLSGADLKFSEDGEIMIRVPWMYQGYTNEDTDAYFEDGYYLSGDLGRLEQGNLLITGRKKDLIIRGGINISPLKIEELLLEREEISECAVVGVKDKEGEEKTCCALAVLPDTDKERLQKEISSQVKEKLGVNYVIDYFLYLDAIPRNLNGKIDKNNIRKCFEEERDG